MTPMVTVAAAREQARRRYERHHAGWAVGVASGEPPAPLPLDLPLHPPTEAQALADEPGAVAWTRSWRDVPGVVWERRRWASLGTQEVPVRLVLTDPADVAGMIGHHGPWKRLVTRAGALLTGWSPRTTDDGERLRQTIRRHARTIAALDELDFGRLRAVVAWLVAHPRSGAYLRQLPIRGIDTKWLGRHRGIVTALLEAITGSADLGLAAMPRLVRVRFLDPAYAPGGLTDVTAPVEQLDALGLRPDVVLVVENLETLVALPPLPGTVAVHGAGDAVDLLGAVRWVAEGTVLYWGDLDSHGFRILDRFRSFCPHARSILMDRQTLEEHRDLWVLEPRPSTAALTRLTDEEEAALAALSAAGGVRLEQERLDWATSIELLSQAVARLRERAQERAQRATARVGTPEHARGRPEHASGPR